MNKIKEFIDGVKKEMAKVSWPTRKELIDNTTVTVVYSILLSVFIFAMDRVYSTALEFLFK
ncbi:preprotein translocase subunit SecE [bacterium]|nr:MAG: preprotein translocase subunit SecE [bacterium]